MTARVLHPCCCEVVPDPNVLLEPGRLLLLLLLLLSVVLPLCIVAVHADLADALAPVGARCKSAGTPAPRLAPAYHSYWRVESGRLAAAGVGGGA